MGTSVVVEGRRPSWNLRMQQQRGITEDTSEKYLEWLIVNNHNQVKKAFDEADAETQ